VVEGLVGLFGVLVPEARVAVGEGAAFHVLSREPDVVSVQRETVADIPEINIGRGAGTSTGAGTGEGTVTGQGVD
jgi:hypothetical protein